MGEIAKSNGKSAQVQRIANGLPSSACKLFFNLHENLLAHGFNPIPQTSPLLNKNEIIYNRAIGADGQINPKSNYFVFVRAENEVKVLYSNPDTSSDAINLKPNQIHRLKKASKNSNSWVQETVQDIESMSQKKPEGNYFFVAHGHWGEIDGKNLMAENIDDGISGQREIIRQMIFYNTDLDGTGHHNNYLYTFRNGTDEVVMNLWKDIISLEQSAGICKVPSVELTMPSGKDSRNGAHHNLWFASDAVAQEYHRKALSKKWNNYCVYSPMADPQELKAYHQQLRSENLLAIGIAHPAAGGAGIGLLNRVKEEMRLGQAIEYIEEYADGIEGFNTDISSSHKLILANPSEMRDLMLLLQKHNCGKKPYVNAINMAFSQEMRAKFGKFIYAGHDLHDYPQVKYKYSINGLGKMFNSIYFGEGLSKKPGAVELVELMRSPDVQSRIIPFIPFDAQSANLVKERLHLTLPDKIISSYNGIKRVLEAAPKIWDALKQQIASLYN